MSYLYLPLGETEIRLLKTGLNKDNQLQCTLEHVQLNPTKPITYTALSYVWGDPKNTVDIVCDEKCLSITQTLELALRVTIEANPHDMLWADQICINQKDTAERSAQVKHMNTIYDRADTVIAWLGPANPSTACAVDMITRISNIAFELTNTNPDAIGDDPIEIEDGAINLEESGKLGIPFTDKGSWAAFSDFYDRPWFERMWIVQEIMPVKEAIIVCGPYKLGWKLVRAAALWYQKKAGLIHNRFQRSVDGISHTVALNLPWRFRSGSRFLFMQRTRQRPLVKWSMREMLETFRSRQASDPRDKVFALLGISTLNKAYETSGLVERGTKFHPDMPPVDYSMSVKELYARTTKCLISQGELMHDDLDVIMGARYRSQEERWPSWVPDWRVSWNYGCDSCVGLPLPNSNLLRQNGKYRRIETNSPLTLGVEGVVLGRVAYKSSQHHFASFVKGGGMIEALDACHSMIQTYPTGEDVGDAYSFTLLGGQIPDSMQDDGFNVQTITRNMLEFKELRLMPTHTQEQQEAHFAAAKNWTEGLAYMTVWMNNMAMVYCERRFFITDTGYMGLGNMALEEQDTIVVLVGLSTPCVLRPKRDAAVNGYEFIGEAYCHGMMKGEAVKNLERGDDGKPRGEIFILH